MFTGLIERIGILREIKVAGKGKRLVICLDGEKSALSKFNLIVGESITINGICVTIEKTWRDKFQVFASTETIEKTTLGEWKAGKRVNLERALKVGDRLGGHIVTGHIDGVGKLLSKNPAGESEIFKFECPSDLMSCIVGKGSVAIDGISLTSFDLDEKGFSVSVIPHTLKWTNLKFLIPEEKINIETDIIGKYLFKLLNSLNQNDKEKKESRKISDKVTIEFLKESGFLK